MKRTVDPIDSLSSVSRNFVWLTLISAETRVLLMLEDLYSLLGIGMHDMDSNPVW
jgi:hypothetical protein